MTKNRLKGNSSDGYTDKGKKIPKSEAYKIAKSDPDYEYYVMENGTKVIRSKPDNTKDDNVNRKK